MEMAQSPGAQVPGIESNAEGRQDTQDMRQVWGQDKHRTVLVTS